MRWARWWTRSPSTAPASSFVPPMSTPMTHPVGTSATIDGGSWPTHPTRSPQHYARYRAALAAAVAQAGLTPKRASPSCGAARRDRDVRGRTPPRRRSRAAPATPWRRAISWALIALVGVGSALGDPVRDQLVDAPPGIPGARPRRHSTAAACRSSRRPTSSCSDPTRDRPAPRSRARDPGGPSRSDTMMLLRTGGGHPARLSIPRDTLVDIPGHGHDEDQRRLLLRRARRWRSRRSRQFLGIKINHVILINFANFPKLVDAMGGVTVHGSWSARSISGGSANGGFTLRPAAGHPPPQRRAGAGARPHPREPVRPGVDRPDPRAAPAEDPELDMKSQLLSFARVHPPAVGRVGRAAGDPDRHGRPHAAAAVRARSSSAARPRPSPRADRRARTSHGAGRAR